MQIILMEQMQIPATFADEMYVLHVPCLCGATSRTPRPASQTLGAIFEIHPVTPCAPNL